MVPAAVVDKTIADLLPLLEAGDILIDGGNSYYVDDIRRAKELRAERHSLRRRRHQRRRVGTRARLLHDDRRRAGAVQHLDPIFAQLAPGIGEHRPHARPREGRRHRRAGLSALRAERRRPLRQDGPQRHRVRHHGRVRRGARHPARRQHRQAHARRRRRDDAAARPGALSVRPRTCADIAEVWRRGSVDRVVAARPDGDGAREGPGARRSSPAASRTPARGAGRSRRPSTKPCRRPC